MENAKELVMKFKGKMKIEVRQQEKLDVAEEKNSRRGELSGRYMVKMLYRWDNGKFETEYLKRLEKN